MDLPVHRFGEVSVHTAEHLHAGDPPHHCQLGRRAYHYPFHAAAAQNRRQAGSDSEHPEISDAAGAHDLHHHGHCLYQPDYRPHQTDDGLRDQPGGCNPVGICSFGDLFAVPDHPEEMAAGCQSRPAEEYSGGIHRAVRPFCIKSSPEHSGRQLCHCTGLCRRDFHD